MATVMRLTTPTIGASGAVGIQGERSVFTSLLVDSLVAVGHTGVIIRTAVFWLNSTATIAASDAMRRAQTKWTCRPPPKVGAIDGLRRGSGQSSNTPINSRLGVTEMPLTTLIPPFKGRASLRFLAAVSRRVNAS